MNGHTRPYGDTKAMFAVLFAILSLLIQSSLGCTRQLREGIVSGGASFAADATYGILAELLPFPLVNVTGGTGGDDPFADEPLQM